MLLLLLSHFSRVRLCATPWTTAHQAPPSLGFSRQEHWSGLPFPSPMHENEKWKWSCSVVSDLATPWTAAHQASPSMGLSRQEYWSRVPLNDLTDFPWEAFGIPGAESSDHTLIVCGRDVQFWTREGRGLYLALGSSPASFPQRPVFAWQH